MVCIIRIIFHTLKQRVLGNVIGPQIYFQVKGKMDLVDILKSLFYVF